MKGIVVKEDKDQERKEKAPEQEKRLQRKYTVEEKLSKLRELVREMPSNAIFMLAKGLYVGQGGFVIKEGNVTHRVGFDADNPLLRKALEKVSGEVIDACVEMKEDYKQVSSWKDEVRIGAVGSRAMFLENSGFTPDLCVTQMGPQLIKEYSEQDKARIMKVVPPLDRQASPVLPESFKDYQDLKSFATSFVDYLNKQLGEKVKVEVKDIRNLSEEDVKTYGITPKERRLPIFGLYQLKDNTVVLFVEPSQIRNIPPSVVAGLVAHEYGHAFTRDFVRLLYEGAIRNLSTDKEEHLAFMRLLSRQAERYADAVGKSITDQLYGEGVYEKKIDYMYQTAKELGIKPVNENSPAPDDPVISYPTKQERKGFQEEGKEINRTRTLKRPRV